MRENTSCDSFAHADTQLFLTVSWLAEEEEELPRGLFKTQRNGDLPVDQTLILLQIHEKPKDRMSIPVVCSVFIVAA